MDAHRQQDLWAITQENYQVARLTEQRGWHNVSVACSYYAVFTAMWVALGDPPKGYWEHRGISKPFARGDWRIPVHPVERQTMTAIRLLYEDRLRADYRGIRFSNEESDAGLRTARQVLRLVADAYSLSHVGDIV